jgi:hypothetical protein
MDLLTRAALSTALKMTVPERLIAAELQVGIGNRIMDRQTTLLETHWQIIRGLIMTVMTVRENYDELSAEWEALDWTASMMGLPPNVRLRTDDNCPPDWKAIDEFLTSPLQTDQDE